MGGTASATGVDFSKGVKLSDLPLNGTTAGRVGDEAVLLSRFDGELFAVSGTCTHYGGGLRGGLDHGNTVRCPLHHACFDLRTGAALRAPALDPLDRWQVDVEGEVAYVRRKLEPVGTAPSPAQRPSSVAIVGGGAAGLACANELRRLGYDGPITMFSADEDPPCDRPNLSKDYLAGTAPEDWIPLRPESWYGEHGIELRLATPIAAIDPEHRTLRSASGETFPFDRLLLATGSEPNRLNAPGFDRPNVLTLRSLADARAIIALAQPGARAAIIGSSFIGLEAAAALRARGVEVTVIAPEAVPFERLLGERVGRYLQALHEAKGVRFNLGRAAASYDGKILRLADGQQVAADFVLVGIGVRPRTELARTAGLTVLNGIEVDSRLEAGVHGIFAAGDIAAYPDPLGGDRLRIEHWAVAERQGQAVAANMLGQDRTFDEVPFFWTEQYGVALRYVGNGAGWNSIEAEGDLAEGNFVARYYVDGAHRATLTAGRDREALDDARALEAMIGRCSPHVASAVRA